MAITVTIATVNRTSKTLLNQLSIDYGLGSDWTATFPVRDMDSTASAYRPSLDQDVVIADGATTLFHGNISHVEDKPIADPHVGTVTVVTVRAKSQVVDQIIVNETYTTGQTRKAIVTDLRTKYLNAYGITIDAGMSTGISLEAQVYKDVTLREVFNHLSVATGDLWRITPGDELQFFAAGEKTAGYTLTVANRQSFGPITWSKTRDKYVNSVLLRYGSEMQVQKTFTATGTGSVSSWVLDYPPAVNASGYLLSRGLVTEDGVDLTLSQPGGGGSYTWTAATNTLTRVAGNLAAGKVISLIYTVQFPQSVTIENAGEIASNGKFAEIFKAPDIFDKFAAVERATGLLRRFLTVPKWVQISTRQGFVMPGDRITLTFSDRTISGDHLITQVRATTIATGTAAYALTCLSGNELQESWTDRFREALGSNGTDTAGGTISGGALPNFSGRFAAEVIGNAGSLADETSLRPSLTGGLTNSSTTGPGLLLGRPDASWTWGLVANYAHLASGSAGGSGRRTLCFMFAPEASGSNGTALELSKDDSNTANVYYLTCPPASTINVGAPQAIIGNGSRVNNLYGSAFEFLSTGICQLFATRPELKFNDSSASRYGRLEQFAASQFGFMQNLRWTGSVYNLDDTAKTGWGVQLADNGTSDSFLIFRATAGSNPRTPTQLLTLFASNALALGHTVDAGGVAVVLPNAQSYCSLNAAGNTVVGLMQLDASDRLLLNANSAVVVVGNASTATTANGGAQTLPGNPVGFWKISLDGGTTTHKIPYYAN